MPGISRSAQCPLPVWVSPPPYARSGHRENTLCTLAMRLPQNSVPLYGDMCRAQRTSTHQHKKILVSGAFRLCSDKRLDQWWTYREHSVKLTLCLFHSRNGTGTPGTMTKIPQPCHVCSGNIAAAKQALQTNQQRISETSCPHLVIWQLCTDCSNGHSVQNMGRCVGHAKRHNMFATIPLVVATTV